MIEVELKNTITAGGAKALKQILCNTKLEESTLDVIGGILDIMTCKGELNQSELVSINESQARVIEKLKEEVEAIKERKNHIRIGDFAMRLFADEEENDSIDITCKDFGTKVLSVGYGFKMLRDLFFRTEEKKEDNLCAKCSKDWFPETCIGCKNGGYHDFEKRSCDNCFYYNLETNNCPHIPGKCTDANNLQLWTAKR